MSFLYKKEEREGWKMDSEHSENEIIRMFKCIIKCLKIIFE